jgi:pimeloyl-ACP methyl ester carboxylesterase
MVNTDDRAAWDALATIAVPTLVVGGGSASHVPQDLLAEVAERIPDGTLVTVEAGHFVHNEAPEAFADAVLDWLDRYGG